jgi:5-methylcytosine-specific restriction protein A
LAQPMTTERIRQLIREGRLSVFYTSGAWLHLRQAVLAMDHGECQRCKAKGRYTPATTVHHVRFVRQYPELALSLTYRGEDGRERRNLVSLCHGCHEEVHGHRHPPKPPPVTPERW